MEPIIDSYINGQFRQMTEQIDEHELYSFWNELNKYLIENCFEPETFPQIVIAYHRVKYR